MRILTSGIAIAAFVAATTTAQAGGLADQIVEAPVVVAEEPAPAGTSINPTYVVLGVLAALLIAAAVNDDDEDEEEIIEEPM